MKSEKRGPDGLSNEAIGALVLILGGGAIGAFMWFMSEPDETSKSSPRPAATEIRCERDLDCWVNRHMAEATVRCKDAIERLALHTHEWTHGWLERPFTRFGWIDRQAGTFTLAGDKIRFQNAFGAWTRHRYLCDYDPRAKRVLDVAAEPGSL